MISIVRKWINRYFANEEAVLLVILLGAGCFVLMTMGHILAPMLASVIIAFLLQGMVQRLRNWGAPKLAAVIVAWLVMVSAMGLTLLVLLPGLSQQTINFAKELRRMVREVQDVVMLLPERFPNMITEAQVNELLQSLTRSIDVSSISSGIVSFSFAQLPVIMGIIIYMVLVPILVFFFLKDSELLTRWFTRLLPDERPVMNQIWKEMNLQIANYVRGKVIEILIVASASYVAFVILGLNYALLLAILVGLSVLIPYIGAAAVTVPVAMIGFFQWGWSSEFITLMVVYGIIQLLDGNVLVPLLFSEAVNLHPVAIILAVLVFGGIWGFWGVFFAIPLATLIKAVFNAWPTATHVLTSEAENPAEP